MDRGAWLATVNGVTKSPTRLSFFHFTLLFSFLDNFIEYILCTIVFHLKYTVSLFW